MLKYVSSKLEIFSLASNSVTLTDTSKIDKVQRKFVKVCNNKLFIKLGTRKYDKILPWLNLIVLRLRRRHLDFFFFFTTDSLTKSLANPSLKLSVYGYPLKQSEVTLCSLLFLY
jgi:hypothetical protein